MAADQKQDSYGSVYILIYLSPAPRVGKPNNLLYCDETLLLMHVQMMKIYIIILTSPT